jgi:predicted nucleic-acid-binding Zn-ribbon protein
MKAKQTCPKCECRRLLVIERLAQPKQKFTNGVVGVSVTTLEVPAQELGLPEPDAYRSEIGHVEAWICSRCGYMEHYAIDAVAALEEYARKFRAGVRVVDHETNAYR